MPLDVKISLKVAGSSESVTVEAGGDLVENDPTFHTDVDKNLFDKLPLESASSSVSSLVTLQRLESLPIPTACSTALVTTRRIRFPSTASPSPTSKAKCSRIRFRWIRSSPWK